MKQIGDIVELQKQDVFVEKCNKCGEFMVNVNPKQVEKGDLVTLKRLGLKLTNPATKDQICLICEISREEEESTLKRKVRDVFSSDNDDDFPFH